MRKTIRKIRRNRARWLATLLALVMILTMAPGMAMATGDRAGETGGQDNAVLEELRALYGENADAAYAVLSQLGFLDESGNLKTDHTVDIDGQSMAINEAIALLEDPNTDLSRIAQVGGVPIALGDLKTMLQIEMEMARIQEKYFSGKTFTQSEMAALDGLMAQIETEGILANFETFSDAGFSALSVSLPLAQAPSDLPVLSIPEWSSGPSSLTINYPNAQSSGMDYYVTTYNMDTSGLAEGQTYSLCWRTANALPDYISLSLRVGNSPTPQNTPIEIKKGDATSLTVRWNGKDIDSDTAQGIRDAFTGSIGSVVEFYDAKGFLFKTGPDTASDSIAFFVRLNKEKAFGLTTWELGPVGIREQKDYSGYDLSSEPYIFQWPFYSTGINLEPEAMRLHSIFETARAIYPEGGRMLAVGAELSGKHGWNYIGGYYMVGAAPEVIKNWVQDEQLSSLLYYTDGYKNANAPTRFHLPINSREYPGMGGDLTKVKMRSLFSMPDDLVADQRIYLSMQATGWVDPWAADGRGLDRVIGLKEGAFPFETMHYDPNTDNFFLGDRIDMESPGLWIFGSPAASAFESIWTDEQKEPYVPLPQIKSIDVPAGTYATGQYVPIAITFNQPVKAAAMSLTINGADVSSTQLGVSNVTARKIVAMYQVKDIDTQNLYISAIKNVDSLLKRVSVIDNGGSGWQFADVHLDSVRMREAVTNLSVTAGEGSDKIVTLDLKTDSENVYQNYYQNYQSNKGHAPFKATVTKTASGSGVVLAEETLWFTMGNTLATAAAVLRDGADSSDPADGIMDMRADAVDAVYTVRIYTDETGDRILLPLRSFGVKAANFTDGLSIIYQADDRDTLFLTETFRPQLRVAFDEPRPTYETGAWTSSNPDVATIHPITGAVNLTDKIGTVNFTFRADDGGLVDPDSSHVKEVTSHTYTIKAGNSPALVIPDNASRIITYKGEKAQVRWSSNANYFNSVTDFNFTIELFEGDFTEAELGGKTPIKTYTIPKYSNSATQTPSTTMEIEEGLLNKLSVNGVPAYTVRVSMPHPLATGEILRAYSYIVVKPLLLIPRISLPAGGQYRLDNQTAAITWSIANFEPGVTQGEFVIKRVSTTNGQDTVTEVWRETVSADSGSYTLTPTQVSGLKDTYMVGLDVKNTGEESGASDGYPLYIYNNGALTLQVNGKNALDALTMDNLFKVNGTNGALPTDTFNIMQMRQELALIEYIGINYGDYDWNQLKDGIKWDTSNHDAATVNYKQGGLYEDITLFTMNTYLPQTQMALSGLKNGHATITATHANTGMSDSVNVDVRTLRDKFYLYQFTPAVKTTLSYTDGKGVQKTATTNDEGTLALYEPDGIASDVQLKSIGGSGNVYLGTIVNVKLLSGERDATKLQLYPLNAYRLRQAAQVEVFLKKPDGSPYTGSVTLRGGAYKNGGYCQNAGLLGNSLPDPVNNPLKDGKQPQTASIGAGGKLTVYMDSLQFWSAEKGEAPGTELKSADDIQYIFEISDVNGYYPLLVYDNGNLMPGDMMRSGGNVVTLETHLGAPGPFISNQRMDYNISGGRLIDVRKSTGHIGPNSTYTDTKLITTALGWGEAPDKAGYKLVISDEYGYIPADQSSTVIRYPFSSMPVIINTLPLNQNTVTKSGWLAAGADVGLRTRLELDEVMLMNRPASPRVTDLTNVQKITDSTDVQAVTANLQGGSAFPGAGAVSMGNKVIDGFLKGMNLFTGSMTGITSKVVITPGEDNTEFNAFIWAGYNSLGLDEMNYDSNGMILDTKLLEVDVSLGPSLKDATEMSRGKYDAKKDFNDAKKAQAEGKGSGSVDVTGQLEGFFDAKIKYNFESQKWDIFIIDGGFTAGFGVNFKYVVNASQVPLTAEFQVGGAGQVDFKANLLREAKDGLPWRQNIESNYVNDYLIGVRLNLYVYAFGGLGFDYSVVALKVGPFGKVQADFAAKFLSRKYLEKEDERLKIGLGLRATGEVGVKFVMGVFPFQIEVIIGSVTAGYQAGWMDWYDIDAYWAENWNSIGTSATGLLSALSASAPVTGMVPVSATATLQSRDYLDEYARSWGSGDQRPSPHSPEYLDAVANALSVDIQRPSPRMLDDPNALATMQTNAYPFSFPLVTEDGQHLLYASDGNSADVFATRMYATKLANGAYAQGSEIAAPGGFDGFGDSGLSLAGSGSFAASAWVRQGVNLPGKNAGDPLSAAEQALVMNGTEIVAAIYDGSGWTSTRLTDNALPDMAPVVASDGKGRAFVAWRSIYAADNSNLFDFSEQDYILYSIYENGTWSAPKRLYSGGSGAVKGITAAMLPDGTAAVAYALDTSGMGVTADYEIGYAIVDQAGEASFSLVVTRDQWLNQNPQLAVAEFGSEMRFVLGWHSMKDGINDIRLTAFDAAGTLSNTFPDSIKEAAGGAGLTIDGNFRFTKMGAAVNDISNLSIIWAETTMDADNVPDHGSLHAVKFSQDGQSVSAALDVADLPRHTFVNHFDAYVSGSDGKTVKAVIQGTLYHDIDPDDPSTYDGYTAPDIEGTEGNPTVIMVPKEEVRLYTATETYANKAQVSGIMADYETLALNSLAPVQFSVFNAGMDRIDSVTVELDGKATTFSGLDLLPNEETMLTCWHTVGDEIENLPYNLTASFGAAQDVLSGTVYLDYPELGISRMETVSEELGKRTVRLTLYNSADATLSGGKDREVHLSFCDDQTFEKFLDVSCTADGVTVNADKTLTISGDAALKLIDEGALVLEVTFDMVKYLGNVKEIPASGISFYANAWITETGANGTNVMPEFYKSDNSTAITFDSPLARTGEPVSIAVEQGVDSGGKAEASITLHNNSLSKRASGNLVVSLLDEKGNVLEQQETYTDSSSLIKLDGEETKTFNFTFGQSGSRVTAIYGDLILSDSSANLSALSFEGLAVRLEDFKLDANNDYVFTAPNTALRSTLVNFVAESSGATVTINGKAAASGQSVSLPENQSAITIEVTSPNGQAVQKYILTVNRTMQTYSVTDHFGTWTGSGTVDARIDADHTKFEKLTYNGVEIDAQHYTITQGSTIITLTENHLSGYPDGTHTFVAHFIDGRSESILLTVNRATVGPKDNSSSNTGVDGTWRTPSTGDTSNMALWIIALIMSATGIFFLRLIHGFRRRRGGRGSEFDAG